MASSFDVIVAGLGGAGSAAACHLARRGARVLGLDSYPPDHKHGSSHGRTRFIREAYFEKPDYVKLVQRAYALWRELEAERGRRLLTITGGLWVGTPESHMVAGSLASARLHALPHEYLTAAEITKRFPAFRFPDSLAGVYEPNAGILDPEDCVRAHLETASEANAALHYSEPVTRWSADGSGVRVETGSSTYMAEKLVLTAGSWAGELLADLGLPLVTERVYNVFFEPRVAGLERLPLYMWYVPEGFYYGVPARPGQGLKFGRHDGGQVCTPATARREVTDAEVAAARSVIDTYLPGAAGHALSTLTCLYTSTPDVDFIVDRHPQHPQVLIGCGFSGHGFKFASVMGEVLAGLALEGRTTQPVAFLSLARFLR